MPERLALYGGTPVRATPLPYGHHTITDADVAAVVQALRDDWITGGPRVAEFERSVAAPKAGGAGDRALDIGAGALDRGADRHALGQTGSDRRGEGAAGAVGMPGFDAWAIPHA